MMRLRQEIAKKYELGQHNTRKKPRKEDDMDGRPFPQTPFPSSSAEEEMIPTEIFIPTFKPNAQIQYENTPLSKATWRTQRCPLAGRSSLTTYLFSSSSPVAFSSSENDKLVFSTITKADVISAISKARGNDLASTRGTSEFGTALRLAKSVSKR
jgi:hypothetical protein